MEKLKSVKQSNNFNLKNLDVELIQRRASTPAKLTLEQLEAMRTGSQTLSASRYSLETICGASCETGAQ